MVALTPAGGLVANAERVGNFVILSPDSIDFRLDSISVGDRLSLYLNHYAYRYDVLGGDSIADARDALLALVAADTRSPYSGSAVGADTLRVTADASGDIWQANALAPAQWTVTQGAKVPALVTQRQMTQAINIATFSTATEPEDGAHIITAKVRAALRMQQYQETFCNEGVSLLGRSPVTDLSAIAGANWETRTSFDLTIGLEAVTSEQVGDIATVTTDVTYKDLDGSTIQVQEFTAPAV